MRYYRRFFGRIGGEMAAVAQFLNALGSSASFIRESVENYDEVGSVIPSSRWLAEKMVSEMERGTRRKPRKFLEIGAGTGAVTKAILPLLGPKDRLDVIECNAELASTVRKIIAASGKADQVTLHTVYIQDFHTDRKYDHIFSSLPLTTFPKELVEKIYTKINQLFKEQATFTYFEYIALGPIRRNILYLSSSGSYGNLCDILNFKRNYCADKQRKEEYVLLNFPPARVVHLKI